MAFKFQSAQGMGDVFDGIRNGVGVIVHWVDTPVIACAVVVHTAYAVNHWVAQIDVARRHVDFQTQGFAAIGEFACTHAGEQIQVFFDAAAAVRAVFARFGQSAAVLAHFFGIEFVHIGFACLD